MHAEDEENDDGWSAAPLVVTEVFVLACVVTRVKPAVTGGVGYWLLRKGLGGSSGSRGHVTLLGSALCSCHIRFKKIPHLILS